MAEPTLLPERLQYRPTKIELDESIEKAKATLLKKIKRSVYVYRVDCGGCNGCEIEIFGSITPVFDVERFGIKVVPSPRHADVLLYTGAVTRAMRMPALRAFEAAPDPKIVVSYGACGCTGGIFYDNYCVWGGTDKILPVDVYIPGCPPSPAQTIYGFAMALGLLDQKLHRRICSSVELFCLPTAWSENEKRMQNAVRLKKCQDGIFVKNVEYLAGNCAFSPTKTAQTC